MWSLIERHTKFKVASILMLALALIMHLFQSEFAAVTIVVSFVLAIIGLIDRLMNE